MPHHQLPAEQVHAFSCFIDSMWHSSRNAQVHAGPWCMQSTSTALNRFQDFQQGHTFCCSCRGENCTVFGGSCNGMTCHVHENSSAHTTRSHYTLKVMAWLHQQHNSVPDCNPVVPPPTPDEIHAKSEHGVRLQVI